MQFAKIQMQFVGASTHTQKSKCNSWVLPKIQMQFAMYTHCKNSSTKIQMQYAKLQMQFVGASRRKKEIEGHLRKPKVKLLHKYITICRAVIKDGNKGQRAKFVARQKNRGVPGNPERPSGLI